MPKAFFLSLERVTELFLTHFVALLQSKEISAMITVSTKETSTNKNEITELKRTLQTLEIDLQSQLALVWAETIAGEDIFN